MRGLGDLDVQRLCHGLKYYLLENGKLGNFLMSCVKELIVRVKKVDEVGMLKGKLI